MECCSCGYVSSKESCVAFSSSVNKEMMHCDTVFLDNSSHTLNVEAMSGGGVVLRVIAASRSVVWEGRGVSPAVFLPLLLLFLLRNDICFNS